MNNFKLEGQKLVMTVGNNEVVVAIFTDMKVAEMLVPIINDHVNIKVVED